MKECSNYILQFATFCSRDNKSITLKSKSRRTSKRHCIICMFTNAFYPVTCTLIVNSWN